MKRSLLLGGDAPPKVTTFGGWLVSTWLPVVIMLVAIAIESTHVFSSENTSGWMRSAFQMFAGKVSDQTWSLVHHIIRKTGHFTGYGLLGLSWMRAWLILWRRPMLHMLRSTYWRYSMVIAIFCTMLIASLDELHQSFMKDRTGIVSDVLLDTGGAVAMLMICTGAMQLFRRNKHSAR